MNQEKLIVALDVATVAEAREIVEELRGAVSKFKIGLQLFTVGGASFVREIVEQGIDVFLDLKFHDIPNTVAKASIEAARLGIWMFNVHALGGVEMMRQAASEVGEFCVKQNISKPKIIGVTVLTSANRESLREVGIDAEVERQVLNLTHLTAQCGLDGVVASPLEISLIRSAVADENFAIVTPGIRLRETENAATKDDQKRVTTASEAFAAGANYIVVGRPILQADDKIAAVNKILEKNAD